MGGALLGVLRNRRKHVVGGELAEATAPVSCRAPAQPPRLPLPALQHHRRPASPCTAEQLPPQPSGPTLGLRSTLVATVPAAAASRRIPFADSAQPQVMPPIATAAQRELLKENRLLQGHHRDSAALYSRDDTIASLGIQRDIRQALHAGWRPQRSMARRGQTPVPEPPFVLSTASPQPCLSAQQLRDPALARFVSRQEILHEDASSQRQPEPAQPHATPSHSVDLEALEVEQAARRLLHESSTEEDMASTVASVPSAQESEDEALAEPAAHSTGVRNGAWAATHCVTAQSWGLYLQENRNIHCLRTACGVPIRAGAFLIQISLRPRCLQASANNTTLARSPEFLVHRPVAHC